jgi:hypothetical protein
LCCICTKKFSVNFVVVASCQRALPLPESIALPPPSIGARVWGWGRKQDRKEAPERARAGDVPMSLISRNALVCCRRGRCWATGRWAYLGHRVGWKISSRIQVFGRILDMIFVLALFSFFPYTYIYTLYIQKFFGKLFWVFS